MTYSIVALDKKTGQFGVAVQSHYFSVGSVVPWAKAGVGAVATQSIVEISYGPLGLELMASGKSAQQALEALIAVDGNKDVRQVAMIDSKGNVAAHTGSKCIPYAGHVVGNGYSCQGNIMRSEKVWTAMANAFEENHNLPFDERLLATLVAGEGAGGDIRGKQSAAILVVSKDIMPLPWQGRIIDLRVEDNPDPINELRRLLRYRRAYELSSKGDELLASKKYAEALQAATKAMEIAPEIEELRYWAAMAFLTVEDKRRDGMSILKEVFQKNSDWKLLTKQLLKSGLAPLDEKLIAALSLD